MTQKPAPDHVFDLTGIRKVESPSGPRPLAMYGGYEGATQMDRTFSGWTPSNGSADSIIRGSKELADSRAKDLGRNDAYVASGAEYHRDTIVGSFYRLVSEPKYRLLGISKEQSAAFAQELEDRWTAWAESPECYADAARRLTFTGLVRLAVYNYVFHQEVLASAEWLRDPTRPTRTAILLLDPDRLRNPMGNNESVTVGARIRGGIEQTRTGEAIAYHIHNERASESVLNGDLMSIRIPARKPWGRRQIIHLVEPTRPGQTRGISQLVTALKETQLGRKYRDIVLQNALANATYAATIESELPSDQIFAMMGQGTQNDPHELLEGVLAAHTAAVGEYVNNSKRLHMNGVKIPVLPPGTKLNLQNAGNPGGVGTDFESSVLRYTAAALGVTFEEMTRDLRETNYSSIRAGMLMTRRTMDSRKAVIADPFANQVLRLWFEEEYNAGRFKTLTGAPGIYDDPMNIDHYLNCQWYGSGVGQVDELKETQAANLRLKSGLSTYKIEIAKLHGGDWLDIMRQIKVEQDYLKENNLLQDKNDNQMNASTGAAGEAGDAEPELIDDEENNDE